MRKELASKRGEMKACEVLVMARQRCSALDGIPSRGLRLVSSVHDIDRSRKRKHRKIS